MFLCLSLVTTGKGKEIYFEEPTFQWGGSCGEEVDYSWNGLDQFAAQGQQATPSTEIVDSPNRLYPEAEQGPRGFLRSEPALLRSGSLDPR